MLPNEDFVSFIEERFLHWEDDAEMINLLMLNLLQKPHTGDFQQFVSNEKLKFAKDLLVSVIEKEEVCDEYIKDKLQNWDPERTAALDMILMRMGICEFLFFETIPPKVTKISGRNRSKSSFVKGVIMVSILLINVGW